MNYHPSGQCLDMGVQEFKRMLQALVCRMASVPENVHGDVQCTRKPWYICVCIYIYVRVYIYKHRQPYLPELYSRVMPCKSVQISVLYKEEQTHASHLGAHGKKRCGDCTAFTPAKPKWKFRGNSLLAKGRKNMGREQERLWTLGFWDTPSSELCQFSH